MDGATVETSDLAGLERETLRGWELYHRESVIEEGEGVVIGRLGWYPGGETN